MKNYRVSFTKVWENNEEHPNTVIIPANDPEHAKSIILKMVKENNHDEPVEVIFEEPYEVSIT